MSPADLQTPELSRQDVEYWENAARLAVGDPWQWILNFVYTKDEHDKSTLRKPFPVKGYHRILARAWNEFDCLFMEKSRQLMITWFYVSMYLHDALFHYSRRIFLQSKKQEDANALLERARHIYDACRFATYPLLGEWLPAVKTVGEKSGTTDKMIFDSVGSEIWAIPQGGDIVRSYTCSGIMGDEMNHQPAFADGHSAAMPTIDGGGRYTAFGTANGYTAAWRIIKGLNDITLKTEGAFLLDSRKLEAKILVPPENLTPEQQRWWIEKQIIDMPDEQFNSIPFVELVANVPGLAYWKTAVGTDCMRVHYTADPAKDPITQKGADWIVAAKRRMISRSKWDREMEINYDTFIGRPVISDFSFDRFVKKCEYLSDEMIYPTYDFGTIRNVTFFCQFISLNGWRQLRFLREIVLDNSNTPVQAEASVKLLTTQFRPTWVNNRIRAFCDPNGDRSEDTTSDKSMNTNIKILRAVGIYPSNRKFGTPESTELIETVFSLSGPNGDPAVLIDPSCEYLISVCNGGLHYPEDGNGRPGYYEKDGVYDHGGDAMRYAIANLFDQYDLSQEDRPAPRPQAVIREPYTGRRIGFKNTKRREYHSQMRKGNHPIYGRE